ncbi:unnamed protein product [Lactuca saligna]|uniref:Uncharacterized protein n=1 Tax=Lactuca saligna TaxID=75948 RepID=A0AA36EKQ9_LACSI|nr:unnamed protein product [Lactuca saligna]
MMCIPCFCDAYLFKDSERFEETYLTLVMASLPVLIVLEQAHVSPPPATVGDRSLPLSFFDIAWLPQPPVHFLFFYEFPLSKAQFVETVVPTLKTSLSTSLQHFYPFAGNLIIYPSCTNNPEIRHQEGDAVNIMIAESSLDFKDLVGNHPRDCEKFYPLIPQLGHAVKVFDYTTIPVFSIQVTLFPNCGVSIGMTNHHCLGDASTRMCFLNAWTSIARSGSGESFLSNGTLPFYDRVIKHPALDEIYLKQAKVETFGEDYKPPCLSGPSDKVRATFMLTRSIVNQMKKWVSTQLPTLPHVSSFIVVCAYIWSSIAKLRNDELELFGFVIDCRARLVPEIPSAYFGNCLVPCMKMAKTNLLTEKEGFVTAAKLLGEKLYEMLNDKDGIMKDAKTWFDFSFEEMPTTIIGVSGTPRLQFYDTDFGWGKPKKHETISNDYSGSFSMNASKESSDDLEIGVSLPAIEMDAFIPIFNAGLENYI